MGRTGRRPQSGKHRFGRAFTWTTEISPQGPLLFMLWTRKGDF